MEGSGREQRAGHGAAAALTEPLRVADRPPSSPLRPMSVPTSAREVASPATEAASSVRDEASSAAGPAHVAITEETRDASEAGVQSVVPVDHSAVFRFGKRSLDIVVALSLLIIALPIYAVVALLVRRDGGPIFFRQQRIGHRGEPFTLYKFRSMAADAEERLHADPDLYRLYVESGFKLTPALDPRVTRLGCLLRSSSLDELPQLWNVLRGDMAMVGARPIVAAEMVEYSSRGALDVYLRGAPGLTGLWQVSGRSKLNYDERVRLDVAYQVNSNLLTDVAIILKTAVVAIRRHGAH
ncbi:MAG: epsE1 [Acidimicrobiales bacterium]|nr:epsE1 [Acidimicrobiales bacterium]